jgi:hypothetical protein
VAVTVAMALLAGCSGGGEQGAGGGDGPPGEDVRFDEVESSAGSFLEVNGWMWFYTTADGITFAEITGRLDQLHRDGIRVIGIYSPYDGDPGKWLGCVARDFYATAPEVGSLADFDALTAAAHARGMKVVSYFGNLNIDRESAFFRTAEEQYASGDRTSREVAAVHWAGDDRGELPTPAYGPSEWAWSETAGAWYWAFWGEPGFDLDLPGARAEVARAERFWLDRGLDGFMFDSGVAHPDLQEAMVEVPLDHGPADKWLTFEATDAERADTYGDFGLTSWFNLEDNDEENDYSQVVVGAATTDDLDEALAGAWEAREDGKLTHAWSPWEPDEYPDPRMRPQEAALLAGAGIAYGAPSSTEYEAWPAATRTAWTRVLATVAEHPALSPAAPRERVPSGDDPRTYAFLATAPGAEAPSVLLAYNLQDRPATLSLDLAGTPVPLDRIDGRAPVDLLTGRPAPPVEVAPYDLDLPAYGYAFLRLPGATG